MAEITQAGEHLNQALARIATADYVGSISNDLHAAVVAASKRLNDPRAPTHDPSRRFKIPRLTTEFIDIQYEEMSLPLKLGPGRAKARKALKSRRETRGPEGKTAGLKALDISDS